MTTAAKPDLIIRAYSMPAVQRVASDGTTIFAIPRPEDPEIGPDGPRPGWAERQRLRRAAARRILARCRKLGIVVSMEADEITMTCRNPLRLRQCARLAGRAYARKLQVRDLLEEEAYTAQQAAVKRAKASAKASRASKARAIQRRQEELAKRTADGEGVGLAFRAPDFQTDPDVSA